jgi:hypothetical protein
VKTFQTYDAHLGDDMKEGPLFLTPIKEPVSKIWYKHKRVGEHKISQWLKVMAEESGVTGKISNKSGR